MRMQLRALLFQETGGHLADLSANAATRLVNDIVEPFLLVYAGLFPIVNPIGNVPIFLTMTRNSETMRPASPGE